MNPLLRLTRTITKEKNDKNDTFFILLTCIFNIHAPKIKTLTTSAFSRLKDNRTYPGTQVKRKKFAHKIGSSSTNDNKDWLHLMSTNNLELQAVQVNGKKTR